MLNVIEKTQKSKLAKGVFSEDGRRVELTGGEAEFTRLLAQKGSVRATDFPPGFRLSAVAHRLKWKRGVKFVTDLEPNASGLGRHAVYRPVGVIEVESFKPRERW